MSTCFLLLMGNRSAQNKNLWQSFVITHRNMNPAPQCSCAFFFVNPTGVNRASSHARAFQLLYATQSKQCNSIHAWGMCFHIHSFCHNCLCARGESHNMRACVIFDEHRPHTPGRQWLTRGRSKQES